MLNSGGGCGARQPAPPPQEVEMDYNYCPNCKFNKLTDKPPCPNYKPASRHEYRGQRPRWKVDVRGRDNLTFLGWIGDKDVWFFSIYNRFIVIVDGYSESVYDAVHPYKLDWRGIVAITRAAWRGLCPPLRPWLRDEPRYARKVDGLVYLGRDRDNDDIYYCNGALFFAASHYPSARPSPCPLLVSFHTLARARARDLGLAVGMSEEEKQAKREEADSVLVEMLNNATDELLLAHSLFERKRTDIEAEHKRKLAALDKEADNG